MVDGVLHLTDELSELRPLRHIRVLKMRGTAPVRGLHSVRISDRGLDVWPRIESRFPTRAVDETLVATGPKLGFGLSELDGMLRGGAPGLAPCCGGSRRGKNRSGCSSLEG